MPKTERLYYDDSHLIEFEAKVTDISERVSGWTAVSLDRTAFYPTGGGQPSDTGTLDGSRVVEVIDDEQAGIWHVLQGRAPGVGATVRGRVDWLRRLDHMQQHTGQHILSQAFVTLYNAPTHSFRVLDQSCQIDVALSHPTAELIERAVELANNVVWEDREVRVLQVTPEQAAKLPLRKDPVRHGELRLIEIADFDLTPCGGTHAQRTGEVGMIAVRSWERARGMTRIDWVAGMRALADYRRANQSARAVAALFSSGREDTPSLVQKVLDENRELQRRGRLLEDLAAKTEAQELLAGSQTLGQSPARLVMQIFADRDAESLRRLALALAAHSESVALLASKDQETARLVFARSADAPGDMNDLMREACALLEGRGGGKPDLAQGGGKNIAQLEHAVEMARQRLVESLSEG
ncbi:MAG TPA: DHHA1 domain-containing protein [Pyrinomonadaceae bacterium]|nr:DHHA1 domain-containing protein [Pyrinomonadaceae bacterium]